MTCTICLRLPRIASTLSHSTNQHSIYHIPPFSSDLMSNYCYRSRIAFFLGWDLLECFCHLLRTLNMDVLLWLSALLFGTFSRCHFGGFWSVRNVLRLVISKKRSLTSMGRWRIGQIYPGYLRRHCLQLQNGSLFILEMCRHSRNQNSWRYTSINLNITFM